MPKRNFDSVVFRLTAEFQVPKSCLWQKQQMGGAYRYRTFKSVDFALAAGLPGKTRITKDWPGWKRWSVSRSAWSVLVTSAVFHLWLFFIIFFSVILLLSPGGFFWLTAPLPLDCVLTEWNALAVERNRFGWMWPSGQALTSKDFGNE